MKKLINFKFKELIESIQYYANKECEGNFSLAVRVLIKKGLVNYSAEKQGDSHLQKDLLK